MLDRTAPRDGEARVRYEDADLTVLRPGRFVRCAISDAQIPLEELRYWNVDRQEAYRGIEEAMIAWRRARAQD